MKHKLFSNLILIITITLIFLLTTACGSKQITIPDRIFILAGEFHGTYLVDYYIDATEVTNAKYAQCVTDGACTPPDSSSSDSFSTYYTDAEFSDYPVIYVNWYQAQDYCTWAGGSLPTEVQWDKAALGSEDKRQYPWGNQSPSCRRANFSDCLDGPSKVGSYPNGASPYGVLDMFGNVIEWVSDWELVTISGEPYNAAYLRGGSWASYQVMFSWVDLSYLYPQDYVSGEIGFRCVYPP